MGDVPRPFNTRNPESVSGARNERAEYSGGSRGETALSEEEIARLLMLSAATGPAGRGLSGKSTVPMYITRSGRVSKPPETFQGR